MKPVLFFFFPFYLVFESSFHLVLFNLAIEKKMTIKNNLHLHLVVTGLAHAHSTLRCQTVGEDMIPGKSWGNMGGDIG